MSKELIKITENNGNVVVSARDLYIGLGYNQSQYSRWVKQYVINNEFFEEGEDWSLLDNRVESLGRGNFSQDYSISLKAAKKLSMLAKTEVGNKIRDYFIECEKKSQENKQLLPDFTDPAAAAIAWAEQYRAKIQLERENHKNETLLIEARPKVEFYDAVTDSKDVIDMAQVAKVLNMGVGRNRLFAILRDNNILTQRNAPMQQYVDNGWLRCVESHYTKPNGDTCINIKTVVFQKGLDGIRKLLNKLKRTELRDYDDV